jgi:PAS domain S-box-containing protein
MDTQTAHERHPGMMKFELTSELLDAIRLHTRDDASALALQRLFEQSLDQAARAREQAEQRLRDGERLYRMLIRNMTDTAVILFDRDMRFLLAEGDALRAVGMDASQIEGRLMHEVLHEEIITFLDPYYRRTLAGETCAVELDYIAGHIYQVRFIPITDAEQVVAGMIFVQDIAEQRQVEQALRESEARYRSVIEAQAELVCRFQPDTTITFVNEAYCKFVGKSADALMGNSFLGLVPDVGHDDALRQIAELLQAPDTVLYAENRLRTGDDSVRWMEWVSRAITDEGGRVVELQAAGRDVTERKLAELALRESEQRFQQIAESVREAFLILDIKSLRFLYISPRYQAITGYPLDAIYNDPRHLISITHPEDQQRVEDAAQRTFQGGEMFNVRHRIYRADGALRWIWGRYFPIINSDGEIYRLVGILEDITERQQQEEQAMRLSLEQQRTKLLTDFITSASHEFRTPLSLINMSLYLMNRAIDPERRNEFSLRIQREVDKIAQLVDHLLLMTRLDSDISIHQGSVYLNEVVDLAYVSQEQAIRQKNHRYSVDLYPELPPVTGDIELLRRAVSALLTNAIQYTEPGGSIQIATRQQSGRVLLSVTDTGIGIGQEALPLIFNRFFREDSSHSTAGFGLGLSIARRVAELHGGTITVESTVGRGSQFTLILPAAPTES